MYAKVIQSICMVMHCQSVTVREIALLRIVKSVPDLKQCSNINALRSICDPAAYLNIIHITFNQGLSASGSFGRVRIMHKPLFSFCNMFGYIPGIFLTTMQILNLLLLSVHPLLYLAHQLPVCICNDVGADLLLIYRLFSDCITHECGCFGIS